MKNKLNLAQISKGGQNEISRERDENINYKRQYKNVKDLVFKKQQSGFWKVINESKKHKLTHFFLKIKF